MFKITGKQEFGAVWAKGKCLVVFKRGIGATDDPDAANALKAMGYAVHGEAPAGEALARMKVDELKAYAAEKGIDIGKAEKKAEILAAIKAAENPAADPNGENE